MYSPELSGRPSLSSEKEITEKGYSEDSKAFYIFVLLTTLYCFYFSFAIKGGLSSTRALQSTPFQNQGRGALRTDGGRTEKRRTDERKSLYLILGSFSLRGRAWFKGT